jgi:hypothetical protein
MDVFDKYLVRKARFNLVMGISIGIALGVLIKVGTGKVQNVLLQDRNNKQAELLLEQKDLIDELENGPHGIEQQEEIARKKFGIVIVHK